ncbi:MAG: hypothetical protein HKN76_22930, partial [Saprospiraceae bacterium]|nr:hypothetical protein [Saprospiraceae bacterium]
MKNLLRFFSLTMMCALGSLAYAQPGPVCTDLNIPVGPDDSATIVIGNFVTNAAMSTPDITLENPYGGVLASLTAAGPLDQIRILACPYVGRELKLVAKNGNGSCWSKITFKQSNGPVIMGRDTTVFCNSPLVTGGHIGGAPPSAILSCTGPVEATLIGDWPMVRECIPGNDTAKVIFRQYEAYDKFGIRGTGQDTIYVLRLPLITPLNTYCVDRDTTYCGEATGEHFGPFMVVENPPGSGMCDTIYFLKPDGTPSIIDPKCGLAIAVEKDEFDNECESVTKYTVSLKQTCFGTGTTVCPVTPSTGLMTVSPGYYTCTFWLMDIDTVPPLVECDMTGANVIGDTVIVPTGSHDCAAHLILPSVVAADSCNDVTAVKALVPGYGSFSLSLSNGRWTSNSPLKIPYTDEPVQIIYEAFDDCHNVGRDTCYIKVKDLTRPIAVCDKGVNVSLTSKKIWVEAETFDEGSWDNCGINMMLVRRSDWQEACVELCDSLETVKYSHYGNIYRPILETNKLIDEVEAHYAKNIEWLGTDGQDCADMIYQAWRYDLMRYATLTCVDSLTEDRFDQEVASLFPMGTDLAELRQIGGGWADDVVFSCDDACGKVTVEILVVDYWCNWNRCWTDVWVEDKTPIHIGKDVIAETDISCKTYKDSRYSLGGSPASIADLVGAAHGGDLAAHDSLDAIFGGYKKAWLDPSTGKYVDLAGDELVCEIDFIDSTCHCSDSTITTMEFDEHLGWIEVVEQVDFCYYRGEHQDLQHGVVEVNCAENVQCERDIWFDFDNCGQGVIYRKFKIYQGCPTTDATSAGHTPDTITRLQKIWVGNNCKLDLGMFNLPKDTTIEVCGITYDPDLSGNVAGELSPENIGEPVYTFDDDCRLVGVGYTDKVFKVVGGDVACYKVIRTWCFADWCEIDKEVNKDITHPDYRDKVLKYKQTIILTDTTPPVVVITPVNADNAVSAAGCSYDFSTTVSVADECGVISYRWTLLDGKGDPVASGDGDLDGDTDFEVAVPGLSAGSYRLRVIITDGCQNEGVGEYDFDVFTGKKPSPVCITSLTMELTPMDLDNDGVIDTGMAVVWAYEFNSSSIAACNDDSLAYYLEFIDGIGDGTLDPEDADSLAIGCEHLPDPFLVRLWVQSFPSGTADFCDVIIVPQNNMSACGDISSVQSGVSGSIKTELETNVEQVKVNASLSSGQEIDFVTTASGAYSFASALGLDVTVTPIKDLDHMNGISTADLIQIQKHILGKSLLESNLREIAADVNNDQRITALDLVQLRKLILGKIEELPDVNSWKFVNDINGQEQYTIKGLSQRMEVDFTGIKMGDVNVTNDPSRSAGRSAGNLVLTAADQKMSRGATYQVDVLAENFTDIEGYQFTLNVDPSKVRITNVKMGEALDLTEENFGFVHVAEGVLTSSWNDAQARTVDQSSVLFTLELEGLTEANLSEVLALNSKVTAAEAYTSSNELLGVSMSFGGTTVDNEFALYQN